MKVIARGSLLLPLLAVLCLAATSAPAVSAASELKLTSSAFANGKQMPGSYSCDAGDQSPPLTIEGVPKGAKSLALVLEDPDAPAGLWAHWVLWNIDPATTQIVPGSAPAGAEQGLNSWQRKGYGGPCPPSGTHRYYFRLYALKERLDLPATTGRNELDRAMQGKILAHCKLLGLYSRK